MNTTQSDSNIVTESIIRSRWFPLSAILPKRLHWRLFLSGLLITDILMLGAAFRLAYFFRFEANFGLFYQSLNPKFGFYQSLILILIPLLLIIFAIGGLYNCKKLLGGTEEYSLIFNATAIGMFVVIAAGFVEPDFVLARGWLLLAWGFSFLFTSTSRFIIRRIGYFLRRRGYLLQNSIIIGANNEGISLAEQLANWKSSGMHIIGFVDKKFPVGTLIKNQLVLGNVDDLDELIKKYEIDEIILASSAYSSRDKIMNIFQTYGISGDVNIRMSSGLYEIFTTGLTVKEFAYVPLVGLNKVRLTGIDHFLKLILDYSLTISGLIFLFPVFVLIALAIKFDSKGPIIFRRRVMGMKGGQFDAYKFRTMVTHGDKILLQFPSLKNELEENHKLKDDPRITRVGKFLRQSSLDELPQLLNVLKREMSLVGPRIITPEEMEKYSRWDRNLLTVRPGITGLWQVSGRSDILYGERVRLDMHYIRNWSIWFDLQILFRTIPAVLRKKGAY